MRRHKSSVVSMGSGIRSLLPGLMYARDCAVESPPHKARVPLGRANQNGRPHQWGAPFSSTILWSPPQRKHALGKEFIEILTRVRGWKWRTRISSWNFLVSELSQYPSFHQPVNQEFWVVIVFLRFLWMNEWITSVSWDKSFSFEYLLKIGMGILWKCCKIVKWVLPGSFKHLKVSCWNGNQSPPEVLSVGGENWRRRQDNVLPGMLLKTEF